VLQSEEHLMRRLTKHVGLLGLAFAGMMMLTWDWQVSLFAWLTPILIIYLVRRNRLVTGLLPLFVLSVVTNVLGTQGMSVVMNDWMFMLIQGVIFAVAFLAPFAVDKLLHKKLPGLLPTLVYPATLVAIEFMNASGGYGSWGMFAHTQFTFPALLQTASLFGSFAISFVVAWFASMANHLFERELTPRNLLRTAGVYAVVLTVLLGFGAIRLEFFSSVDETVRVAALTNDTELFGLVENLDHASDYLSTEETIDKQINRTEQAAAIGAKIIAWHEASLAVDDEILDKMIADVASITRTHDAYVLIAYLKVIDPQADGKRFRNQTALIAPDGEVKWTYDKSHPVPGAELAYTVAGSGDIPYLDTEYGRIGAVICYDIDFYDLLRQTSTKDIDILLVPSNDWEGITPIHTYMASMEAIQNGFSMVRACAHGFTGVFNWNGTLLAGMNDFETDSDLLLADVPTSGKRTLYGSIGNSFALICVGFVAVVLVLRIVGAIRTWRLRKQSKIMIKRS